MIPSKSIVPLVSVMMVFFALGRLFGRWADSEQIETLKEQIKLRDQTIEIYRYALGILPRR